MFTLFLVCYCLYGLHYILVLVGVGLGVFTNKATHSFWLVGQGTILPDVVVVQGSHTSLATYTCVHVVRESPVLCVTVAVKGELLQM